MTIPPYKLYKNDVFLEEGFPHLSIFVRQSNGFEDLLPLSLTIAAVLHLISVDVVVVWMLLIALFVDISCLLFHFWVEISPHHLINVPLLLFTIFLVELLSFINTLQEGHQPRFDNFDFVLIFKVKCDALFLVVREELGFVTERVEEHQLLQVELVGAALQPFLEEPDEEGGLVKITLFIWRDRVHIWFTPGVPCLKSKLIQ